MASGLHRSFICALLLTQLAACANAEQVVELRGQRFQVELARTPNEQARGLMFRESLPADAGMLFIFQSEKPRSFWMKNTRIPLDILYFNSKLELVSAARNARPCAVQACPPYPSEGPAMYVLEINGGLSGELGVTRGDELILYFTP